MTSAQVSIAEFLEGCEAAEESTETTDETDTDVDGHEDDIYSQIVFASRSGERYHKARAGIVPACPMIEAERITLGEAKNRGLKSCGVCGPVKYPCDETDENTAMEGLL